MSSSDRIGRLYKTRNPVGEGSYRKRTYCRVNLDLLDFGRGSRHVIQSWFEHICSENQDVGLTVTPSKSNSIEGGEEGMFVTKIVRWRGEHRAKESRNQRPALNLAQTRGV